MKLSVIIVSYNVKHYLEQCLRSVERALDGMDAETIVIDNHSRDDSVSYLSARFPRVTFISSQHNLGFSRANNKAIRQCRGEYVLLLNPDTVVGEDVLRQAVAFMDQHPQAGGVGVRMLKTDGTDALESRRGVPTLITSFYKMSGLCARFPRSRRFGKYYMGYLPWDEPAQIEIISGAFCLLRRQALDSVGLLDEDFFMYGEDIDLSYRLLKNGWENWYLPLRILHYKGESTQKSSFRYVHVFYEAMLIFFRKHYGHLSWLVTVPIQTAIYLKATVALLSMQMDKTRQMLGFTRRQPEELAYICCVTEEHLDRCRQLTQSCGLNASFVIAEEALEDLSLPQDAPASPGPTYLVVDTAAFSYSDMLTFFANHRECGWQMAFYYPSDHRIITDRDIFSF